jgi:hypothetical protein
MVQKMPEPRDFLAEDPASLALEVFDAGQPVLNAGCLSPITE